MPFESKPVRALLAEDSPTDQFLFKFLITESYENVKVKIAKNASEARDMAPNFDFLVIDRHLGIEDGLALGRELHKLDWRKPKMLLTGDSTVLDSPSEACSIFDWVEDKNNTDRWLPLIAAVLRAVAARKRCA